MKSTFEIPNLQMKFKCIEVAGKLSRIARQWINRVEELQEFIAGIGMQATERKNETVMPKCAKAGKYEHEYIRHGTQSLIASFDIKTGRVVAECGNSQKASDLVGFIEKVAEKYINERTIHIIWDNLNIQTDGADERWIEFNKKYEGKFKFHYTPKHASWVNQIELFFSIVYKKCLKFASFMSKEDLRDRIQKFITLWNEKNKHPFNWTFKVYPMQSVAK